jgi:hypothetical protein
MAKEFSSQAEREAFAENIREKYGGHSALSKLVEGLVNLEVVRNDSRCARDRTAVEV